MLSEFAKVFERRVWRVQVAYLHNAACTLLSPSRCFQLSTNLDKDFFVIFDIVVKNIECGLAWSLLLSPTIRVITVVKICCGLTRRGLVSPQHLTTVACEQAHLFGNREPAKPARRMRRGHIILFARDTLTNEWACSQAMTTVLTRIVVDKNTDLAKPHSMVKSIYFRRIFEWTPHWPPLTAAHKPWAYTSHDFVRAVRCL